MYFIKIAEGRLCHCTYCVINKAKGYIKSFPKEKIIEQFKNGISLGYSNIFLTAEDVFAYGFERENDENIRDLLESMLNIKKNVVFYFNYIKPL
jgi:tRNA A37 methylthiotransferase MiaB